MGRQSKSAITAANATLAAKEGVSPMFSDATEYVEPIQDEVVAFDAENDNPRPSDWVIFKLKNNNRHGKVHIHGECAAINPKTGKVDSILLIRGEEEIWASVLKQKYGSQFLEISKDKRTDLIIEDRVIRIPSWDTSAVEFMRNHKDCVDKKQRMGISRNEFFEYNPQRQAELALLKQQRAVEAMQECFGLNDVAAKKLALFYGVSLSDELGELKNSSLIKRDLALKAQEDPERFIRTVNDPIVEISYLVAKALAENKIDVSSQEGKAYFANNGAFICSIPNKQQAKAKLVEFATLGGSASSDFVDNLKLALK